VNAIFLDIDGVLNCSTTKERVANGMVVGIDPVMTERLRRIVDATGAKLILTSTAWKVTNKEYLEKKLGEYGLVLHDKTNDRGDNRGYGILMWASHNDVDRWVVLDDEEFSDYRPFGITNHLVKTSWKHGLQEEDVCIAIEKLGGNKRGK